MTPLIEPAPWVRHPDGACAIETTLRLIGGKWKAPILYYLHGGAKRYGELKALLPGISAQVLTGCLRELESDRLVSRRVWAEVPPRTEYRLTETGESLEPLVRAMGDWGRRYEAEAR